MESNTFTSQHFTVAEHEIEDALSRTGMQYKHAGGDQFVVKDCPFCEASGQPIKGKATNQNKLYFTRESGAYYCQRCKAKGSFYDYKKAMGLISPIEHVSGKQKKPKMPHQAKVNVYQFDLDRYEGVAKYLEEKRKIKRETLELYQVGAAEYNFQDEESGNWIPETCITFPWIHVTQLKKAITVRVKARSLSNKSNMRLEPAGGSWGFFGWHTIPQDCAEICITEGEYDAMSVWQETGIPSISLPNGSNNLPPELLPLLESFETIYLWMDDDIAGQDSAADFAKKLGPKRTKIVPTKLNRPDGPKDANECLQRGENVYDRIQRAQFLPHDEILTAADLRDDVFREVLNPGETDGIPYDNFLPKMTKIVKGWRRGELDVLTGGTGTGKTTILSQQTIALAQKGVSTCWGSFEIKNHRLAKKMLYQSAKKDLSKHPAELQGYWNDFTQMPLWFMKFFGSTNVDKILDAMDYVAYAYDVKNFVLDNLQFMTAGQGRGNAKFELQDEAIDKFRQFATERNRKVTLVIHPRKVGKGFEMDNSSVGGTAKATQEADNVFILQTGMFYRYLEVTKNRYDGDLGRIPYEYLKEQHVIRELTPEEIEQKRNADVESSEDHGMVSQAQIYNRPKKRKKRDSFGSSAKQQDKPSFDYTPPPRRDIPNYADGIAHKNANSIGASHD